MNKIEPFKYNYFSFNIGDEVYMHTLNHLMHHSGWYVIKDMYIIDKWEGDGISGRSRGLIVKEPNGCKMSDETYLHLYDNLVKYEEGRMNNTIAPLDIGSRMMGSERDGEDEYAYYTRYGIEPVKNHRHNSEWMPYIYMLDRYSNRRSMGMSSGYKQEFHYILEDDNGKEFDVEVTGPLFTIPDEIEEGDAAEKIKAANHFQYNGGEVPLLSSYESSLIEFFEEIYKPTIRRVRL